METETRLAQLLSDYLQTRFSLSWTHMTTVWRLTGANRAFFEITSDEGSRYKITVEKVND